ncbi:MAG: hypothetical protein ACOC8Y_04840 [Candidatus Natronoplasma sp.]
MLALVFLLTPSTTVLPVGIEKRSSHMNRLLLKDPSRNDENKRDIENDGRISRR